MNFNSKLFSWREKKKTDFGLPSNSSIHQWPLLLISPGMMVAAIELVNKEMVKSSKKWKENDNSHSYHVRGGWLVIRNMRQN